MVAVEIESITADTAVPALKMKAVVGTEDTVGAIIDGMPMVASTPYLVTLAETACFRLIEGLLDRGQISVGRHLAIDHLGPSKVGAVLAVDATLSERKGSKFVCDIKIHDGERLVASVQHIRIAVDRDVIMNSLR
jgi:fluoroacetyl-CoA thioesterase